MICTPEALVSAAYCYTSLPQEQLIQADISLLCYWANHLTPVACGNQGPAWMNTPSVGFAGDFGGINNPLPVPPYPPFPATYFYVHWGSIAGGPYPNSVLVPLADIHNWFSVLPNPWYTYFIPGGTYYFVVQGFDNLDHCSDMSGETVHTFALVPAGPTPLWNPATETVTWIDAVGTHVSDLTAFTLYADMATTSSMVFGGTGLIISLTGIQFASALVNLDVSDNALTSSDINAALIALDASGLLAGTVDLSGQTPIAPPTTVAALNAVASLRGKGWTVTVDQPQWLPVTEVASWVDGGGPGNGNLAAFQAGADYATLTSLVFGATGNLTSLTAIQGLPLLAVLDVNTNGLTALDCTGLAALTTLDCSSNASLATLTLTGCTALGALTCDHCALTALNLAGLSALVVLGCNDNALTSLTLTGCVAITDIDCSSNTLIALDTSPCVPLDYCDCHSNSITSLDFSFNLIMETLDCHGNAGLASLVMGNSPKYVTVHGEGLALPDTPNGINDCLVALQLNCIINPGGIVFLDGGTSSAPTIGPPDGIAAKTALSLAGWNVVTN